MRREMLLSISEFSKISGINRKKLIYYDTVNLFKPALVKPNGYRFYAHWQVETIATICILSDLGMPLDEIRHYLNQYDSIRALEVLREQLSVIDSKIKKLCAAREMLRTRISMIEEGKSATVNTFRIVDQKEIPIFISEAFRHNGDKIPDEKWSAFYTAREKQSIPLCSPVGYIILPNAVVKGDCKISFQNKAKGQGLGLAFSLLLIQFLENDTQRSARKILFVNEKLS